MLGTAYVRQAAVVSLEQYRMRQVPWFGAPVPSWFREEEDRPQRPRTTSEYLATLHLSALTHYI